MAQLEQIADTAPPGPAPAAETAPTSIADVIERMRALGALCPEGDGVGVFNEVYLAVTEAIGGELGTGGFPDRTATSVLDVRFAEHYLTAIGTAERGGLAPECWRPLLQFRRHPGVRPIQFALAGINAHIGHDLALAVVDSCRTLGCAPPDLEDEFERVGDLLVTLEERIREDLMPGPDLLEIADPLTHLLTSWSLQRARDGAWSSAKVLWRLRAVPPLAEEFRRRTDATVGLVGRFLLTPCG